LLDVVVPFVDDDINLSRLENESTERNKTILRINGIFSFSLEVTYDKLPTNHPGRSFNC